MGKSEIIDEHLVDEFSQRLDGEVYVSDFYPPPDNDDGIRLTPPPTEPSQPDSKSFPEDPRDLPSARAYEYAGQCGTFAFAAAAHSENKVVLA